MSAPTLDKLVLVDTQRLAVTEVLLVLDVQCDRGEVQQAVVHRQHGFCPGAVAERLLQVASRQGILDGERPHARAAEG